jgi:hypothetical protein
LRTLSLLLVLLVVVPAMAVAEPIVVGVMSMPVTKGETPLDPSVGVELEAHLIKLLSKDPALVVFSRTELLRELEGLAESERQAKLDARQASYLVDVSITRGLGKVFLSVKLIPVRRKQVVFRWAGRGPELSDAVRQLDAAVPELIRKLVADAGAVQTVPSVCVPQE